MNQLSSEYRYIALDPIIDIYSLKKIFHCKDYYSKQEPLHVEIGFGQGEVLIQNALDYPDVNFLGIEPNWQRILRALKTIRRLRYQNQNTSLLKNLKIVRTDAHILLDHFFFPQTIDHIYCFFPEPWPKKRHAKHRLFDLDFLKLLNNRLKEKCSIRIITDHKPYFNWIAEQNDASFFSIQSQVVKTEFGTKFEKKWKRKGQHDFYEINLLKQNHSERSEPEGVVVQGYKINQFNPEKFIVNDEKNTCSIIFRDFIFDPQRQKGSVRLIVSENHLTQYFSVAILQKKDVWRVYAEDGQQFLPTPGIARAVTLVYEAAKNTIND